MTNKVDVAVIDAQLAFLRLEMKRLDGHNTAWSQRAMVTFAGIIETLTALRKEKQMTGMNGKPIDMTAPSLWEELLAVQKISLEPGRGLLGAAAAALETIHGIASGSTTANSLPNIARIAREGVRLPRPGE